MVEVEIVPDPRADARTVHQDRSPAAHAPLGLRRRRRDDESENHHRDPQSDSAHAGAPR